MSSKRKYAPSNGSEGTYFVENNCMKCVHCNPDPDEQPQCEILMKVMLYSVDEPEYPSEWTYDKNDDPVCTKRKAWDWDLQGDPWDPNNENAFGLSFDPNQLKIFPDEDKED